MATPQPSANTTPGSGSGFHGSNSASVDGAFFLTSAYKDGVSELASLQYSAFDASVVPCSGDAVVITRSSAVSGNGACPINWPGISCTCLSNSAATSDSEWVFRVKSKQRIPATTAPPSKLDVSAGTLEVSTLGQFALPKKVKTLRLLGDTTDKPLDFEFDLTAPYSLDGTVSLVLSESENFISEVEVANIGLENVYISDQFLPPSVSRLTLRNCGISTLPSPYLFARWAKLLTIDFSGNNLTDWYSSDDTDLSKTPTDPCTVTSLNLAHNKLTSIPTSLAWMQSLQNVNMSGNPITNFTVGEELYNRISGLKSFAFDGIDTSSVTPKTCPDGSTRKLSDKVTLCVISTNSSSNKSMTLVWVAIFGGVVIVALVIALIALHKKNRKNNRDKAVSRTLNDDSSLRSGFESIPAVHSNNSLSMAMSGGYNTLIDTAVLNDPLIITSRLDHHELRFGELIKQGGFGTVYSGVYKRRRVAIKMIRSEYWNDVKLAESFLKEIALMASLQHPRIVEYIGCAWENVKTLSMVTELMTRGDLREVLQQYKRSNMSLTWTDHKGRIALHVAEALQYLHTLSPKVIHRDLKSKNILINNDLDAKLTDFGISREGRFEQTHMTAGIGTSFWIAPEVLAGLRYDERADIYSFGVVLSEIDTDDYPYWNEESEREDRQQQQGATQEGLILRKVLSGEMRPGFSRECPQAIRILAERCLEGEPSRRPSSREVVEYLSPLVEAPRELRHLMLT